jgi:hypothetical protein
MSPAIFCIVNSASQVMQILDDLKNSGFANYDISVLGRTPGHQGQPASPPMKGALEWLPDHQMMTIAAVGPVLAAGPILGTLNDMRLCSSANRLAGALLDIGVAESDARLYEDLLCNGAVLMAVHSDEGESDTTARGIFYRNHASDICVAWQTWAHAA